MTELEQYLTEWLTERGYELEVHECDDEFFYCEPLSFIAVATTGKDIDAHFLRFVRELGCTLDFSNAFIPEFLHEVGHDNVNGDFDDDEWEEYREWEHTFVGRDMSTYEAQLEYLNHPIERAATQWAVDYINSHEEEIAAMADRLGKIFNTRKED